jgi:hypothetical protein
VTWVPYLKRIWPIPPMGKLDSCEYMKDGKFTPTFEPRARSATARPAKRPPSGGVEQSKTAVSEIMATRKGFEPLTYGLGNRCSILLSYRITRILFSMHANLWKRNRLASIRCLATPACFNHIEASLVCMLQPYLYAARFAFMLDDAFRGWNSYCHD